MCLASCLHCINWHTHSTSWVLHTWVMARIVRVSIAHEKIAMSETQNCSKEPGQKCMHDFVFGCLCVVRLENFIYSCVRSQPKNMAYFSGQTMENVRFPTLFVVFVDKYWRCWRWYPTNGGLRIPKKNEINCVRANSLNFFVCIIQFQMLLPVSCTLQNYLIHLHGKVELFRNPWRYTKRFNYDRCLV